VDAASARESLVESRKNPTKLRDGKDGGQIGNRQRGAWVGASTWRAWELEDLTLVTSSTSRRSKDSS